MYQSILVPLDGSLFGEQALPIACVLARRAGATLRLVHVHTLSASPIYVKGQAIIDKDLVSLSHEHERSYLEQVKASLVAASLTAADKTELKIVVEAVDRSLESIGNEPVGTFLATYAAKTQSDLVVMTTHGRGGMARFWLGSVADALIRLSNVPILLIHPREDVPDLAQPPIYKRILIPLDGSALAEKSLQPALALGSLLGAEYTLLRVVEPLLPVYSMFSVYPSMPVNAITQTDEIDEAASQEAKRYLDQVAQRWVAAGQQVQTRVLLAAQPATAILERVAEHKYDLIVLATHGLSGLQRLVMGSVADKVLRGATLPILIYRPPVVEDEV